MRQQLCQQLAPAGVNSQGVIAWDMHTRDPRPLRLLRQIVDYTICKDRVKFEKVTHCGSHGACPLRMTTLSMPDHVDQVACHMLATT